VATRLETGTSIADLAAFSPQAVFREVSLSPNGTRMATVTSDRGLRWLSFIDLRTGKLQAVINPGFGSMVGSVHWVNEERVIFDLLEARQGHEPEPTGELYSVAADGTEGRILCGPRARTRLRSNLSIRREGFSAKRCGDFLARRPGLRDTVVITAEGDGPYDEGWLQLMRLDATNGSTYELADQPPHLTASVAVDEAGEPRLATAVAEGGQRSFFFRDREIGGWQPVPMLRGARPHDQPLGFSAHLRALTLLAHEGGEMKLVALDVDRGTRRELAITTRKELTGGLLTEPTTGRVLAVATGEDDGDWLILDPESPMSQLLQGLRAEHNDHRVRLTSITDNERLAIAHVFDGPDDPGRFLLVDTVLWRMDQVDPQQPLEQRPARP
jgi:hypothetical protein